MRKMLLATFLGAMLMMAPDRAMAGGCGTLGWHCTGAWTSPVPLYFNQGFYPPPVYPYPYAYSYPYPYNYSYFRPDAPYGWNANRNWRDTWQDDGVKLHTYTLH
jgi:hypothetical protein